VETYSNKFDQHKSQEQERVNREALYRREGPDPVVGGTCTPQSDVISERPGHTTDAQLSWAGGQQVISPGGPGDIPFTAEHARVAGVSGGGLEHTTENPRPSLGTVTSSPLSVESRSGRHMNTNEILGGR